MRDERVRTVTEVAFSFVTATLVASVLFHLQAVPFIRANLHALVAAVFLLLPQLMLRRRAVDIEHYGFTTQPRKLGLLIAAVSIAMVLPLFVGGFVAYQRGICAWHPQWAPASCFLILHPHFRLPPDFLLLTATQVIVVALPEELFFRGYLQGRLEDAFPPTRAVLGAKLGGAWLVTAALFGLGHFLVTFEPQMLTRFFPGLIFGWMFARTRSILAGTLFHAACNMLMDVLARSFYA